MSKDLHNMDDIFNSAYREFADDPSSGVWEKINAGLDKKDAASYKRRLISWKRVAILLLLLLTGFILYEAGILKTGSRHSKENIPIAIAIQKPEKNAAKEDETINQDHSFPGKSNNEDPNSVSKKISNKNENNIGAIISQGGNILTKVPDKTEEQKASVPDRKVKAIGENDKMEIVITPLTPRKYQKDFLKDTESLSKEKTIIPLIEKNNTGETAAKLLNGTRQFHLSAMNDSFAMSSAAKNKKQKWVSKFKPFWTIIGFASNEWANYRLDNDMQTVQKIKQRETHEPSLSAGILLSRQLMPKWGLQTGLIYSKTSIGINPQKIYAFNDPAGSISYKYIASSGYGYVKPDFGSPPSVGDSLTAREAKHTLQHISVPLVITYRIEKNKLSIMPGVGIAANFQTSAKIETEVEDGSHREIVSINKLNGTRSFYLSITADAELQYKLNNKISINFRPSFSYAISPITKDNVVETYPYSFGAGVGLTYRF